MPAPVNQFKADLAAGKQMYGCWAGFADPYATEVMGTAGFDWLVIDGEHAPNDLRSITAQLQVLRSSASHPIVRLPMGEDWLIKQVLDVGAQSLLIPMVESGAQAEGLVRATRYPPEGIRGSGAALGRASMFSDLPNYTVTANAQICLLVQVETVAGMEALDDILAMDGVDGVFIGPSDLGADMCYPGNSRAEPVQAAIQDALSRINASSKAAGCLATDGDTARRCRDWGAQFLAEGSGVLLLAGAARTLAAGWHER
mgnify:FL=1